jgi:hypothetical protein
MKNLVIRAETLRILGGTPPRLCPTGPESTTTAAAAVCPTTSGPTTSVPSLPNRGGGVTRVTTSITSGPSMARPSRFRCPLASTKAGREI